jgi:hypothetical protein
MYSIKVEHHAITRWYQSDNYWDALELFDLLTKTCMFVQVLKGMEVVREYNNQ